MKKYILFLIQGALVGIGAILPGISGGVLCVAFGIYESMMELLTNPIKTIKKQYKMFIPFIIGWIIGFIILAKGIELLFVKSASIAMMLFFGLICGTLPDLFKTSEKSDSKKSWTPFVLSLAIAYIFFHLLENGKSINMAPSFFGFLLCGVLWGFSLIIPGVSSSSILIYLGLYEPMTSGIGNLDLNVLIPMGIGIVTIALLFARIVNMLYKKHYAITSRIVLGFVVASSLKIIPSNFTSTTNLIISIGCFIIGFVIARLMDIVSNKQNDLSAREGN